MSVTARTLGTVAVGLVGLFVYLAAYVTGVYGITAVASVFVWVGLVLTAVFLLVILALCTGRTVEHE
ncbi:hypothetical protein [Roseospirillum parvum]|uniref:Uncharacterized protein n=1 Tax=Roseospirillum parvum TaxID=83401 RepID=A0A1G7YJX0_9PROT|nr:hypothetical protein [Roseospirillum parvum]SDG96687.1 hypothetical protein SAMN05421742_103326 [Roseospirillum parvum]